MKKIIIGIVVMILGVWTVTADLSDWLFCQIKKDQVTISLKQTTGYYKCNDTILSLEHLIIETAKDLMKVQTYINRWRDVEYRKTVKLQKKSLLDILQLSRMTILTNMKIFQSNLLQKSVQYFIVKITPYKISLQKSLIKISALTLSGYSTPALSSYEQLLKAQVNVIDKFTTATTQTEITDLLIKYVYLKKQIEWKYE